MIGIGVPNFIKAFAREAIKTAVIGGVARQVLKGEHALERMAPVGLGGRGVTASVVENAIKVGTATAGKYPGTVEHVFENVTAVTNTAGDKVITIIKTGH